MPRRAATGLALPIALLGPLLLVSCGPERPAEEPGAGSPPNILWLTIDTIRQDRMGAYGYFRDTTPNFDRLAEESILFERCVAPQATTLPSHLSTLTSTYPLEHGVVANVRGGGKAFSPAPGLVSLASFLDERGYATAAFVSATPLKDWSGIQRGFQVYEAPEEGQRPGDQTTDLALAWLAQRDARPFFLWVHLFDPHSPHDPPPPFDAAFSDEPALDAYLSERRFQPVYHRSRGETEQPNELSNAYDGEVLFTDHQLGRLLAALRESELLDATALVILGDHGEGLGQHGERGHGHIWREQLLQPLLMRVPGEGPRRVSRPLSGVDVFPTLLGLIEVPDAELYLASATGIDVLREPAGERALLSQSSLRADKVGLPLTYALTTETWKYVSDVEGNHRLYDLRSDPFELVDLAPSRPEEVARFEALLAERIAQLQARAAELGTGATTEIDSQTLEELRALGYLGGE